MEVNTINELTVANGINADGVLIKDGKITGNIESAGVSIFNGTLNVGSATILGLGTSDITSGTLSVTRGGTGTTSHTSGNFLIGAGTGAVTSSKVAPSGDVVGTSDSQTLTNKTIDATNNTLNNIADSSIKTAAAIDATKIAGGTVNNSEFGYLDGVTSGIQTQLNNKAALSHTHAASAIVSGTLLVNRGGTGTSSLTSGRFLIGAGTSAVTTTKVVPTGDVVGTTDSQTITNKTINASNNTLTNIVNLNIANGAAIDAAKIHDGTVDNTEFGYLNGVTSAIQTQLDGKLPNSHESITNGIHGVTGNVVGDSDAQTITNKTIDASLNSLANIVNSNIASGAAIDATKIHDGSVSNTEYGYLNGLTSAIQTQLDNKLPNSHESATSGIHGVTGNIVGDSDAQTVTNKTINALLNTLSNIVNANIASAAAIDATKIHDGTVDNSEFGYLNGVTSAIQAQLDGKLPSSHESTTSGIHGVTGNVVGDSDAQTMTNKTVNALLNTVSNIVNANIASGAAIDATKIHDGTVDNTEFGYLNGVTSALQTQLDGKLSNSHESTTNGIHGVTGNVVGDSDTQTITNKTINASLNTVSNIVNANIANGAAIDATKIHDGTVDNTEFGYLNGVTSAIQTQLDGKAASSHTHAAADVVSGSFADARISESSVTQHADALEIALNHDSLTNYVANEHIDHSTINIVAGEGLSGGGAITASRTLDLDIASLTADVSPDGAADYVVTFDASANEHKKVLLNNFTNTTTASNVGTAGVGIFKQKSGTDLQFKKINAGSSKVTITDDTGNDEIDIDIAPNNISINDLSGAPSGAVVGNSDTQTLTNKTINALLNTVSSIGNANIANGAAIDATKIHDGTVNNTEFGYLNGVSSAIQTQIDNHTGNISNPHAVTASQVGNTIAQWNANKIQDIDVSSATPTVNQTLVYNGTQYEPGHTFDQDVTAIIMDDFIGASISTIWVQKYSGTGAAVGIINGIGGQIEIKSGNSTNDSARLDSSFKVANIASTVCLKIRLKMDATTQTKINMGLFSDSNNLADFQYNASASSVNWFARTINSGTSTSTDTSTSGDTNWHIFEMRTSSSDVKFYIDGSLVATNTTNLYTGLMSIYILQTSNNNANHYVCVDFIKSISDREGNSAGSGGGDDGGCIIL